MNTHSSQHKKTRWPWIAGGILLLAMLGRACDKPPSHSIARPTGLSSDSMNKLAGIINLNGELCAKVQTVTPAGNDVYTVTCTRYRDGTGQATYMVDIKTGRVK